MKKILYRYFWRFIFWAGFLLIPNFVWAISATDSEFNETFNQLSMGVYQEDNRTLGNTQTLRIIDQLLVHENYQIQGGFSWNIKNNTINALFIEFGYQNINDSGWSLNLKFMGNQYPEYVKTANSLIPYLGWNEGACYFDLGLNYRFLNSDTNHNYHSGIFEMIFYYKFGLRCTLKDLGLITTIEVNNNDEMSAGNLGAYGLFLKNEFMINPNTIVFANLGLRQSGSIGLAAITYEKTIYWGLEERF